jgi:hypothetical protein
MGSRFLQSNRPTGSSSESVPVEETTIRIVDIALLPESCNRACDDAAAGVSGRGRSQREAASHPRRALQSRAEALRAPRFPPDRKPRRLPVHGVAREPSRAPLGRAVAQLARDDDAGEHIRLAHGSNALGHPPLRLSYEMREDVRIEQIESRHVRVLSAPPPAVELATGPRQAA